MPLYEYQCAKCGARLEKIQKFSDAPLVVCEKCGGELVRLISAPAIQFKGTGWYVTDYARKSSASGASSSSSSSASTEKSASSSPSTKTETKPSGKDGSKS